MEKKQLNNVWEIYGKTHGIKFEFTTLYAHQQNGIVEKSICLLLDGT